jgi:ABC-2 type transport system permease protein
MIVPVILRANYWAKSFAFVEVEARKLRRDPTELLSRAVQPALWLLVFGEVFTRTRAIPTGGLRYLDFMAPGILAQSVLFTAIFYGLSIIWERDLGLLQKYLVSPTPRSALIMGKAMSAGVRGLAQSVIVYGLSTALGVQIDWRPFAILGTLAAVVLGAGVFATLSLVIACIVRSRERFMGIGQVLTMPLFFASNAIYPITFMPPWLKVVSHLNPLTYEVDLLRQLMIVNGPANFSPIVDLAALVASFVVLASIAAKMIPNLGR